MPACRSVLTTMPLASPPLRAVPLFPPQRIILIVQVSMDPLRSVDELQWWYLALMVLTGWFVQSFAFEAVANANACELGAFVVVSIFLVIRDALG